MSTDSYKLILNEITANVPAFGKEFELYKRYAFLFLNYKGKHLFVDEILNRYSENMTLERLLEEEKDHFIQGSNHKRKGKMQATWYDIQSLEEVVVGDDFFDFFFATKLTQLELSEINDFLHFHLEYSFNGNQKELQGFLNLCLAQFGDALLNINLIETVKGWTKVNCLDVNTDKDEKIKGRLPREAGDHLTSLNLNQTALLIQYMQQSGIILKDEYLTYAQAGKAFYLLTGYSSHTIRQQLGAKGEIEGVKFEDYKELQRVLAGLMRLIEAKIPKR